MNRRSFDCGVCDAFAQDDNVKEGKLEETGLFDCGVCDAFAQDDQRLFKGGANAVLECRRSAVGFQQSAMGDNPAITAVGEEGLTPWSTR